VLAVRQSPYGEIRVVSHEEKRFLLIDGGIHTVVSPDNWETYFAYVPVFDIPRMFFDRPGRLLLVGLGGGSVARNYAAENWRVDAVEIDAAVTAVAREFFGFTDSDATVYEMDGRAFLMAHEGPWDIIAVDAFGSSSIPFHLVSAEAFALLASRLSPEGILAVNIEAVGWNDPLVSAIAATLRRSFGQVVALPIAEPPNMVGNLVLLACDRPLEFDEERLGRPYHLLAQPYLHWCSVQRNHAWNNRFQPDTRGAPVFTDELNPVDLMTESVNLAARRNLHENPELRGLAW
jgi:spermidine synthase